MSQSNWSRAWLSKEAFRFYGVVFLLVITVLRFFAAATPEKPPATPQQPARQQAQQTQQQARSEYSILWGAVKISRTREAHQEKEPEKKVARGRGKKNRPE